MNIHNILDYSKKVVNEVAYEILNSNYSSDYHFDSVIDNEIKSKIDMISESKIVELLKPTSIPILSEESGFINKNSTHTYKWVLDPIDGTYNFIRKCGPATISLALMNDESIEFGIIFSLNNNKMYWGGKKYGSFCGDTILSVSEISDQNKSCIYTGLPVRFVKSNGLDPYITKMQKFGKIRMIGCASASLLNVALGYGEVYFENEIMIWDVAAGIGLVEGAGGECTIQHSDMNRYALNLYAHNGKFAYVS